MYIMEDSHCHVIFQKYAQIVLLRLLCTGTQVLSFTCKAIKKYSTKQTFTTVQCNLELDKSMLQVK